MIPRFDGLRIKLQRCGANQLNYRVERDLLKEVYSSNLQIINGVLVFFLGVISIKAASLLEGGNHQRASEYIAVGLELDAKNVILLNQKAMCLWKSGELHRALAIFKEALNNDSNDLGAASNAMEVALFAGALDDFRALFAKHKAELDKVYASELTLYFQVVESYQSGNPRLAIGQIINFLSAQTEQKKRVGPWVFPDGIAFFSSKPASQERDAVLEFLNVLNGSGAPQAAREKIEKLFSTPSA